MVVRFILDPAVIRARGTAMLVSTVPMMEVVTVMYALLFRSRRRIAAHPSRRPGTNLPPQKSMAGSTVPTPGNSIAQVSAQCCHHRHGLLAAKITLCAEIPGESADEVADQSDSVQCPLLAVLHR